MAESNKYENSKFVEIFWHQKYDRIELVEKMPIEKLNLPFQTIETINKPTIKDLEVRLHLKKNSIADYK